MKIGFVGVGKLGLPVALAIESKGHQVEVWDSSPPVILNIQRRVLHYEEAGAQALLNRSKINVTPPATLANWADLVFVAVQTPHEPRFEGTTPLPDDRADFDYTHLVAAVKELADHSTPEHPVTIAVISTVLPGTMRRLIKPVLGSARLVYNPSFIAMGTAVDDFLHPEFTLIGSDWEYPGATKLLEEFYATIHDAPLALVSVESAELTKVAYNTMLGLKLAFVNVMAQVAEDTGADVDEVTRSLGRATRRLWDPKHYFTAGMGDGGGCHPRDNIALSHVARQLGMGHDLFEALMRSRDAHSAWLARIVAGEASWERLPVVLLGAAYKANSGLTVGSPAVLLSNMLTTMGVAHEVYDPLALGRLQSGWVGHHAVYVVATNHRIFHETIKTLPAGSVLIDPWGQYHPPATVRLVTPGRRVP